jgi:RNA polymerase sigma-70 factor (ECF subfamily)
MKTVAASTAEELAVLKGTAIRPRPAGVIDDATAQARRQSVLANGIDQIHEQYRRRVYSWCLRIVRNVEDAEDLTQDAFLLLCRKINTYRGESAFSTWLYRLVTNIALMRMRKKTPAQTPLEDILETRKGAINPCQELKSSIRAMAASAARVDLERMFEQMPSGYRKAFFLHDSEDYSHPEIAVITGWSIGTSKSQLHRARRHLRKLLECGHDKASRDHDGSSIRPGKNARPVRQPPPHSGTNPAE